MSDTRRFRIGDATLTRVEYFDVCLPPEAVALTAGDITNVPWATPVWAESESAVRVGQAFWVVESDGRTIVIDPCCASDDYLRTGPEASTHQDGAFAAFAAAGFDPAAVDVVVMSHLDGIGMNALVEADGTWRPAFANAPIVVSEREWARVVDQPDISGAAALRTLHAAGHVSVVPLPFPVTPAVTLVPAPGHTPGMAAVVVQSAGARALFLGHLAVNPLHAVAEHPIGLHDDPELGARALREWLAGAAADDALVVGPLWPSPGAARVTGRDAFVLTPADA